MKPVKSDISIHDAMAVVAKEVSDTQKIRDFSREDVEKVKTGAMLAEVFVLNRFDRPENLPFISSWLNKLSLLNRIYLAVLLVFSKKSFFKRVTGLKIK